MSEAAERALEQADAQRRLSKAELLQPKVVERSEFIDSLGGTVLLRSLTLGERTEIRKQSKFGTPQFDEDLSEALALITMIRDPALTLEDLEALRQQNTAVIDEITMKCTLLSISSMRGAPLEETKKD